jgi:hypothetical protein
MERHPWLASVGLLTRLGMLAGGGALLRLLVAPGLDVAVGAWAVAAVVLAVPLYRATSPRARREVPRPAGAWQPGEAPPAGVPAATIEAAARVFAQLPPGWRGAWLEIAPCTDPVRHGLCRRASAMPAGGMIRVVLGEHIAARPADAVFVMAHEARHPAGWTRHLSLITIAARQAGWLAAGWAAPWPWLLATVIAVQAAYAAACWATEAGCDVGGARVAGRDAALGFFAHRQALGREPKPGSPWGRRARSLLIAAAVPTAHPPWRLRAIIVRALVPAGRRA